MSQRWSDLAVVRKQQSCGLGSDTANEMIEQPARIEHGHVALKVWKRPGAKKKGLLTYRQEDLRPGSGTRQPLPGGDVALSRSDRPGAKSASFVRVGPGSPIRNGSVSRRRYRMATRQFCPVSFAPKLSQDDLATDLRKAKPKLSADLPIVPGSFGVANVGACVSAEIPNTHPRKNQKSCIRHHPVQTLCPVSLGPPDPLIPLRQSPRR